MKIVSTIHEILLFFPKIALVSVEFLFLFLWKMSSKSMILFPKSWGKEFFALAHIVIRFNFCFIKIWRCYIKKVSLARKRIFNFFFKNCFNHDQVEKCRKITNISFLVKILSTVIIIVFIPNIFFSFQFLSFIFSYLP